MCDLDPVNDNLVTVDSFTADKTIDKSALFYGTTGGCAMPTGCKMEYENGTALTATESSKILIDANGEVTLIHSGYPIAAEH